MSEIPEPDERPAAAAGASVDAAEIARFAAQAEAWWDPRGAFAPLHRLNPVRLAFVRDQAARRFGRDPRAGTPLAGLALLDIGCGGGLLSEPLARLGAAVTAIDAGAATIAAASAHALESGLAIDYRATSAEALAAEGRRFDLVLAMEVVEHVADLDGFLGAALSLLAPHGLMVLATLNRTPQSFAFAIVGAEYLLRWLPRGTHQWRKFVRPSELAARLRAGGARLAALKGVSYSPLTGAFALSDDLSVNYMAVAEKD